MAHIDYSASGLEIREEIVAAHEAVLERFAFRLKRGELCFALVQQAQVLAPGEQARRPRNGKPTHHEQSRKRRMLRHFRPLNRRGGSPHSHRRTESQLTPSRKAILRGSRPIAPTPRHMD